MKPSTLKPGDQVLVDVRRRMTFLKRNRAQCGQPAENWFQCDEYKGLHGPTDDGRCKMTDAYCAKHCERI